MKLNEAIMTLTDGHKIRKTTWLPDNFLYLRLSEKILQDSELVDHQGIDYYFGASDIYSQWEIYEEPEKIYIKANQK